MQRLLDIRSSGPQGPAYLRFSHAPVATSGPVDEDDDVILDEAADGSIVGVEVVALVPQTIVALARVAERLSLDLSPLFGEPPTSLAA